MPSLFDDMERLRAQQQTSAREAEDLQNAAATERQRRWAEAVTVAGEFRDLMTAHRVRPQPLNALISYSEAGRRSLPLFSPIRRSKQEEVDTGFRGWGPILPVFQSHSVRGDWYSIGPGPFVTTEGHLIRTAWFPGPWSEERVRAAMEMPATFRLEQAMESGRVVGGYAVSDALGGSGWDSRPDWVAQDRPAPMDELHQRHLEAGYFSADSVRQLREELAASAINWLSFSQG